jgi:putative ABC transport system permease protein
MRSLSWHAGIALTGVLVLGLRKALGARQRDVVLQFLVDRVMLTAVDGVIGIGLGVDTSAAAGAFNPLPTNIAW